MCFFIFSGPRRGRLSREAEVGRFQRNFQRFPDAFLTEGLNGHLKKGAEGSDFQGNFQKLKVARGVRFPREFLEIYIEAKRSCVNPSASTPTLILVIWLSKRRPTSRALPSPPRGSAGPAAWQPASPHGAPSAWQVIFDARRARPVLGLRCCWRSTDEVGILAPTILLLLLRNPRGEL